MRKVPEPITYFIPQRPLSERFGALARPWLPKPRPNQLLRTKKKKIPDAGSVAEGDAKKRFGSDEKKTLFPFGNDVYAAPILHASIAAFNFNGHGGHVLSCSVGGFDLGGNDGLAGLDRENFLSLPLAAGGGGFWWGIAVTW